MEVEPGIRWHVSVSPTLVLARSSNAAAQLPLRGQSEREALRSYPTGQVRRKEKYPHTTLHRSRPYAIIDSINRAQFSAPLVEIFIFRSWE
jgi:hypothetical protein